jgi:hypothetical protein
MSTRSCLFIGIAPRDSVSFLEQIAEKERTAKCLGLLVDL